MKVPQENYHNVRIIRTNMSWCDSNQCTIRKVYKDKKKHFTVRLVRICFCEISKSKNVLINVAKHALFLSQKLHLCQASQKGHIRVLITLRKKFIVILKITYTSYRVPIAVTKLLVNQSLN